MRVQWDMKNKIGTMLLLVAVFVSGLGLGFFAGFRYGFSNAVVDKAGEVQQAVANTYSEVREGTKAALTTSTSAFTSGTTALSAGIATGITSGSKERAKGALEGFLNRAGN